MEYYLYFVLFTSLILMPLTLWRIKFKDYSSKKDFFNVFWITFIGAPIMFVVFIIILLGAQDSNI